MDDSRLHNCELANCLAENFLSTSSRKRFRNSVKNNLNLMGIGVGNWETLTSDRQQWRHLTACVDSFESNKVLVLGSKELGGRMEVPC